MSRKPNRDSKRVVYPRAARRPERSPLAMRWQDMPATPRQMKAVKRLATATGVQAPENPTRGEAAEFIGARLFERPDIAREFHRRTQQARHARGAAILAEAARRRAG